MRHVGYDIRALRKSSGRTLKNVADAVQRSVAWLSQVERGHAVPSVSDLAKIAEHLGMNISYFFRNSKRDSNEHGLIQRGTDTYALGSPDSGMTEELLSPHLGGSFEMIRTTFFPGYAGTGQKTSPEVEHGGVVISGEIMLEIDGFETLLKAGDSFQFQNKKYSWRNETADPAVAIWIVSPPVY